MAKKPYDGLFEAQSELINKIQAEAAEMKRKAQSWSVYSDADRQTETVTVLASMLHEQARTNLLLIQLLQEVRRMGGAFSSGGDDRE